MNAEVLNLNTAETEWLRLFTKMASTTAAPETKDSVIADVYRCMMVSALEKSFIKEIATGMVTEAEISTRIGTARRKLSVEEIAEDNEVSVEFVLQVQLDRQENKRGCR